MLYSIENATIIQQSDWDTIRHYLDIAREQIRQGRWDHKKIYDQSTKTEHYSLESHGVISDIEIDDHAFWTFWDGAWVESLLPWTRGMRAKLAEAGLPVTNIYYSSNSVTIPAHKDRKFLGVNSDQPHTNINYVISSENPEASYTWVRDEQGQELRYYSHPGKLWMINASNLHGVVTDGFRDVLGMKFHYPFDQVKNFFDRNPDFFDANQPYF
jgi:hypothetical protein